MKRDILRGYLYIIISGEEFNNAAQFVFGSFMLRLGSPINKYNS